MEAFAVFETWHLADGNYPALRTGQLVNLSFEINPHEWAKVDDARPQEFRHLGQGEYDFTGVVLRSYQDESLDPILVIEANQFRFYTNASIGHPLAPGTKLGGRGTLLLDHYLWVEFLANYPDPPDLFYKLRVAEIDRVQEREPRRVDQVEMVTDEDWVFFVIRFIDSDVPSAPVPRTFLG